MGCIPVCTPAGGIKNVIRNGENGFLAKSFESADLYNSIKETLANAATINRDAIIKEYEKEYSMKTCTEKYISVYQP